MLSPFIEKAYYIFFCSIFPSLFSNRDVIFLLYLVLNDYLCPNMNNVKIRVKKVFVALIKEKNVLIHLICNLRIGLF